MLGNVDNKTTDVSGPEELIGLHKLVSNFERHSLDRCLSERYVGWRLKGAQLTF